MGCKTSTNLGEEGIEEHYLRLKLPTIDGKIYQNQFEREAFITISLLRADPGSMVKHVNRFKKHPSYKGQSMTALINNLLKMTPQTIISFDEIANKACRENTEKQMGKEKFEKGGNTQEYLSLVSKEVKTSDDTRVSWDGTALELIISLLVEGFAANGSHPIVDPKLGKVGISFRSHKKLSNIFQILYVNNPSNQMD